MDNYAWSLQIRYCEVLLYLVLDIPYYYRINSFVSNDTKDENITMLSKNIYYPCESPNQPTATGHPLSSTTGRRVAEQQKLHRKTLSNDQSQFYVSIHDYQRNEERERERERESERARERESERARERERERERKTNFFRWVLPLCILDSIASKRGDQKFEIENRIRFPCRFFRPSLVCLTISPWVRVF